MVLLLEFFLEALEPMQLEHDFRLTCCDIDKDKCPVDKLKNRYPKVECNENSDFINIEKKPNYDIISLMWDTDKLIAYS